MARHPKARVAVVSHDWGTTTGAGRCAVELRELLEGQENVELVDLAEGAPLGPRRDLMRKLRRALALWAAFRRQGVDVVVVNTTVQSSLVIAARLAGCAVVWWCHESGVAVQSSLMRFRWWIYDHLCQVSVAVTGSAPKTRTRQVVIRNIVGFSHRLDVHSDERTLLVFGTKCWRKGTDLLPRVLDPTRMDHEVRLLVVGRDEPRETELLESTRAELARRWGSRLEWLPAMDAPAAYRRASALLLPSRGETRPRVVEEALANGIPVVAAPLPGLHDIARDVRAPEALTLVPTDQDWTGAVQRALLLGRQPRTLVEEVSPADFAAAWTQLIESVAAARRS